MEPLLPITSREKLEAWLRYYEDLNLGDFYKDRKTMGKRSVKSAAAPKKTVAQSMPAPAAVMSPPAAKALAAQLLPIVPAPTMFGSLDRIVGDTLEQIREDLGECTRCRLHEQRNKIVFGAGSPKAELVFVGEGPGRDEDMQGFPFVGRAGKLLDPDDRSDGSYARGRLYLQRSEMPSAGKPQAGGR